jgi:hypothetical protein
MVSLRHTVAVGWHRVPSETGEKVQTAWWHELLWVVAAGAVGFATTAILAGWLEMSRSWLVLVYAAVTLPLFVGYLRWSRLDLGALFRHRWRLGVVGAIVASAILIAAVVNEDSSPRPEGFDLAFDLFWLGVVYGLIDALLLNVLPVMATWRALSRLGWTEHWRGRIAAGALAVAASLAVTAAYHLGYPEFQGSDVREPLIGNSIMSVAYVLTNNPISAMVSHVAMHVAAVLQGAETTTQLPPHY